MSGTSGPKYPLQTPNQVCDDLAAVEKIFGKNTTALRKLSGYDEKSLHFGNPIDPAFQDARIAPVELRGFGPNHSQSIHLKINRALHALLSAAFDEIATAGMSYQLRANDAGGFLFRYTKNDDVSGAIVKRPEYGLYDPKTATAKWKPPGHWADKCAEMDRKSNSFEMEIPVFRHKTGKTTMTKKKDLLSNHSWGTALDLNYSTNDFSSKARFDMPPIIVSILTKYGFYWGGYYHDYMHFEFLQPSPQGQGYQLPSSHVVFPFGERGKPESPTKYFFLNEHHGRGGYFPLGLYQNLHGGIHLNPLSGGTDEPVEDSDLPEDAAALDQEMDEAATPAPVTESSGPLNAVHTALPGYLVAARLVDPKLYATNEVLRKNVEDQPLGFVLIRHELKLPKKKDQAESTERWPLFSLYMHLAAPNWDALSAEEVKATKGFEAAPWLEKFLRMEHGGVVALDPEQSEDFGKTFWASAKFDAKGTAPVPVRGRDQPLKRRDGEQSERIVGYGKPSPDAIATAIASFKQGAVVTFDRAVLPVAAGEIVGFLDGASAAGSRRYLHWEIFSEPNQGLAKLRELAKDLGITFDEPLKELRDDNFLEMPSIRNPGAQNEIDACFKKKDSVLNPVLTRVPYAKKLVEAFHKGDDFAEGGQKPFHYATTLRFANPFHFRPESGADWSVAITYLAGGKTVESTSENITESGEELTLKLDVPAAADLVRLQSKHFRLELSPPPLPEGTKPDDKAAEKARTSVNKSRRALWKAVTGRRWRGLVLEHINEWTSENLAKYIKTKLKAAYFESTQETDRNKLGKELEEKLAPLTWYAAPKATEKPHGEQTALGDGARQPSIFEGAKPILPKDGHLESMHPATTLWLLDLLLEEGKIAMQEGWPADNLIAEAPADDPPFLTVVEPTGGSTVGAQVGLALVQHGYLLSSDCKDSGVVFVAHPEDHEPRILALASYVDGAAVAKVRFPFWRKTEIKVQARGKDGTGERDLVPKEKGKTILDLAPPERQGMQLALVRAASGKSPANDRTWTGTILVKDACPYALEGYLAFNYWKADAGKQPDFSVPGTPGTVLWPVLAERSPDEEHERDGLKLKGDFIVGAAGKKGKGGSARAIRVSADYVLADFMNKKVAEAEGDDFRLALPLAQRLQALRDVCKADRKGEPSVTFSILKVAMDGLSIALTPARSATTEALLDRASRLPASDLFELRQTSDGSSLRLTYSPLPTTASLTFTTDPGPALQALATAVSTKAGEQVFARPTFLAPNGGHHIFTHLEKAPVITEDQTIAATAEDVFAACAGDCIQLEADVVFPPAHAFGFSPIAITMGRGSLRTTVTLLGPAREWNNARPRITCTVDGTPIVGGAREGDTVSDYWYLEKWTKPKARRKKPPEPPELVAHRWGKTFEFKAEATNTKGMPTPPAPMTARFVAEPKLLSLEAKLEGDDVVFTGKAQAMPTSSELGIRCERQDESGTWRIASKVANALGYQRASSVSPGAWGCVSEEMVFTATVPKAVFGLYSYRFTWHAVSFSEVPGEQATDLTFKVAKFDNLKISPCASRVYSGAELGGVAGGEVEPEPDVPRIDEEGTHGSL